MAEGGDIEMDVFDRGDLDDDEEEGTTFIASDGTRLNIDKERELAILSIPQDKDTDELRRELPKEKTNNFYIHTQAESKYTLAIDIDPNNFKLGQGDRLYAKRGTRSWVELTYKSNPRKFKSLNTIQRIAAWHL